MSIAYLSLRDLKIPRSNPEREWLIILFVFIICTISEGAGSSFLAHSYILELEVFILTMI